MQTEIVARHVPLWAGQSKRHAHKLALPSDAELCEGAGHLGLDGVLADASPCSILAPALTFRQGCDQPRFRRSQAEDRDNLLIERHGLALEIGNQQQGERRMVSVVLPQTMRKVLIREFAAK